MPEIKLPEFLTKPGVKFTKEDLDNVIANGCTMELPNDIIFYFAVNPFRVGPYTRFGIKIGNEVRKFNFLYGDKTKIFDEKTFLSLGKNPNLLALL